MEHLSTAFSTFLKRNHRFISAVRTAFELGSKGKEIKIIEAPASIEGIADRQFTKMKHRLVDNP
ncbi:hypothetical protein SAMN05421781_1279 [Marinococcus luteus]|uniref:Uncharacterized protein n=1 Tax=Marinococcus luteus TaxID=1122204 RepID=A0A1H2T836_9BACI|nr:hypothetical protein SAMN05421781_1279 [Marinococcus luteus]